MCRRRTGRPWGFPQPPRVTLTRVTLTVVLWTACLAAEVDGADLDGPPRGWASPGTVSPVPPPANGLLDAAPASTSSTLDRIVQGLGPLFASRPPAPGTSVGSPPGSRPPSPRAPRHALDFPPVADTPQRDRVEAGLSQIFQPPPPPPPLPPPNAPGTTTPPPPPPSLVRPGAPRNCYDIEVLNRSLQCQRGENARLCASLRTRSLLAGCHDLTQGDLLGPSLMTAAFELGLVTTPPPPAPPPRVPPPPPPPPSPPPSSPPPPGPSPPPPPRPPPPSPPPPSPPPPNPPPPSPPPPSPPPPPWFTEQWSVLTPGAPPTPPGPTLRVPPTGVKPPPPPSRPPPIVYEPSPPPWFVGEWSEVSFFYFHHWAIRLTSCFVYS